MNCTNQSEAYAILGLAVEKAPNDYFIDIGANHGLFSMFAIKKGAKHVITVEPQAELCEYIVDTMRRNNVDSKVMTLYNNAVLDERTKVRMRIGFLV